MSSHIYKVSLPLQNINLRKPLISGVIYCKQTMALILFNIFFGDFFQHSTIEAVLDRGEKLDDLVSKSEGLSVQSKAFYKTARKTNSCCSYVG